LRGFVVASSLLVVLPVDGTAWMGWVVWHTRRCTDCTIMCCSAVFKWKVVVVVNLMNLSYYFPGECAS